MTRKELYRQVVAYFEKTMPQASSELHYGDAFQLLVAVILSAQCTDKRVNMVTPALFAAYPDARAMSQASEEEIFSYIHSVSYPNSKSRYLAEMSRQLVAEFGGKVPSDIDDMQRLTGVGRKTANVVAAVYFQQPAMPVDTHVFRVSERIGLTCGSRSPRETEETLVHNIAGEKLASAHHWLLLHGRYVCKSRNPQCDSCGLSDICAYHKKKREAADR